MALSFLIYVSRAASNVVLVEWFERPDGQVEERDPPRELPDRRTTLNIYGSLFFASARKLERLLPTPEGTRHPVVILRLRGKTPMGATLVRVLSDYADQVVAADGRLYIVGLGPGEHRQLLGTGTFHTTGSVQAHEATPVIGESIRMAREDAQGWLESLDDGPGRTE